MRWVRTPKRENNFASAEAGRGESGKGLRVNNSQRNERKLVEVGDSRLQRGSYYVTRLLKYSHTRFDTSSPETCG